MQPTIQPTTPHQGLRIAIGHKARSGKDTFADYMVAQYPNTTRMAFADKLYTVAARVQTELGYQPVKDPKLLQALGQSMKHVYGPNVWVDIIEKKILATDPMVNIIVTDLRFPQEWDMLQRHGFTRVKINRPNRPIDRDPNDISEIALDDYLFDHVIENIGSMDDYRSAIDRLLSDLRPYRGG